MLGLQVPLIGYFVKFKKKMTNEETDYSFSKQTITRKYPLRGYILGVLTHTTALDRLWGDDETLGMWF